jgi:hypothetical protein
MATLTNNRKMRAPRKVTVKILDSTYNVKYSKKFLTWTTVQEIKGYMQKKNGVKPSKQRLFQHQSEIFSKNATVESLLEGEDEGEVVHLTLRYYNSEKEKEPYVRPFIDSMMRHDRIKLLVAAVNKGLHMGLAPQVVGFGVSGSYFLRGPDKNNLVIFKPLDEEPYAPNNQKGYVGKFGSKSMREGILSGEGAAREVAAYMLDNKHVHKVPETFFAEVYHPMFADGTDSASAKKDLGAMLNVPSNVLRNGVKYGSVQIMKDNDGESCDFSCRKFPAVEVQSIAVLDMRILNCDRNEGNILVRKTGKDTFTLIPIDHGLCLSDSLSICDYELCWSIWPHVEQPTDEKLQEYIMTLDTRANARMLKKCLRIRAICLRNYRIAETLLVKATQKGMTLFEISKIMYKLDPEGPKSVLENIVAKAEEIFSVVKTSVSKGLYLQLNDVHMKSRKDFPQLTLINSHSKTSTEMSAGEKAVEKQASGDMTPTKSPTQGVKRTLFLDSSQVKVNSFGSSQPHEDTTRKRAQSYYQGNDQVEEGVVRLEPLVLEKGRSDQHRKSHWVENSPVHRLIPSPLEPIVEQTKIFHRTATKESPTLLEEPKRLRKTISNPDLRASPKLSTPSSKAHSEKYEDYDEMFFYYYENILQQVLDKIYRSKAHKNRDRTQSFYS